MTDWRKLFSANESIVFVIGKGKADFFYKTDFNEKACVSVHEPN